MHDQLISTWLPVWVIARPQTDTLHTVYIEHGMEWEDFCFSHAGSSMYTICLEKGIHCGSSMYTICLEKGIHCGSYRRRRKSVERTNITGIDERDIQ